MKDKKKYRILITTKVEFTHVYETWERLGYEKMAMIYIRSINNRLSRKEVIIIQLYTDGDWNYEDFKTIDDFKKNQKITRKPKPITAKEFLEETSKIPIDDFILNIESTMWRLNIKQRV